MSRGKQDQAGIASAEGQNRTTRPEPVHTVPEGVLEDLDAVVERLRIAEDLVRELSGRLLVRHQELLALRAVAGEFRGGA